jgi:hypothetical protein
MFDNKISVEQWKQILVEVMMRDKNRLWKKEELFIQAELLAMEKGLK